MAIDANLAPSLIMVILHRMISLPSCYCLFAFVDRTETMYPESYLLYDETNYQAELQRALLTRLPPGQTGGKETHSLNSAEFPAVGVDFAKLNEFLATLDAKLENEKLSNKEIRRNRMLRASGGGKIQNLLVLIDNRIASVAERKKLQRLLMDSQPRQSKWVKLSIVLFIF